MLVSRNWLLGLSRVRSLSDCHNPAIVSGLNIITTEEIFWRMPDSSYIYLLNLGNDKCIMVVYHYF